MRAPNRLGRIGLEALILSVAAAVFVPTAAAATTYAVNTTDDLNDANGCVSIPECSLREAVNAVNSGNHSEMGGGGILAPFESGAPGGPTTTIISSLIAGNKVFGGAMDGQGGGIAAFGDLTMTNSTVTNNSVGNPGLNEGGGIVSAS